MISAESNPLKWLVYKRWVRVKWSAVKSDVMSASGGEKCSDFLQKFMENSAAEEFEVKGG